MEQILKHITSYILFLFLVAIPANARMVTRHYKDAKYKGEYYQHRPHGFGTYTWKDGRKYVGKFDCGVMTNGTFYWPNGDTYKGTFQNGNLKEGTLTYANGDVYVGEFAGTHKSGKGTYTWENGDRYVGSFASGNMHGDGKLTYAQTGYVLTGTWSYGSYPSGPLSVNVYYNDGSRFVGFFSNNLPHGKGMFISAKGDTCTGIWTDGQNSGKCIMHYHNGDVYQGEMRDNVPYGQGCMTYKKPKLVNYDEMGWEGVFLKKETGEWSNGLCEGVDEISYSSTDTRIIYSGEARNGKPHGKGLYINLEEHESYEGNFQDGKFNGYGELKDLRDGSIAKGTFTNGEDNFIGSLFDSNGVKIDCQLVNGKLNGENKIYNNGKLIAIVHYSNGIVDGLFTEYLSDGIKKDIMMHNDAPVGDFTLTYPDGSVYIGSIDENDEPHGFGKYTHSDFSYEGGFVHGKMSGEGTLTRGDMVTKGTWENNKLNGNIRRWENNKLCYEGNVDDYAYSGQGTMYYENGDKYVGNWENNMRNGQGTLYFANGDKYSGNWKDDKRSGHGTLYYKEGGRDSGEWSNDKLEQMQSRQSAPSSSQQQNNSQQQSNTYYQPQLVKVRQICSTCHGTGKCPKCDGTGIYWYWVNNDHRYMECGFCGHYHGVCPICHGEGGTYVDEWR